MSNAWTQVKDTSLSGAFFPPASRYSHTAITVKGEDNKDKVLMFGGEHVRTVNDTSLMNDMWLLDPITNTWKMLSTGGCGAGETGISSLINVTEIVFFISCIAVVSGIMLTWVLRKPKPALRQINTNDEESNRPLLMK